MLMDEAEEGIAAFIEKRKPNWRLDSRLSGDEGGALRARLQRIDPPGELVEHVLGACAR